MFTKGLMTHLRNVKNVYVHGKGVLNLPRFYSCYFFYSSSHLETEHPQKAVQSRIQPVLEG